MAVSCLTAAYHETVDNGGLGGAGGIGVAGSTQVDGKHVGRIVGAQWVLGVYEFDVVHLVVAPLVAHEYCLVEQVRHLGAVGGVDGAFVDVHIGLVALVASINAHTGLDGESRGRCLVEMAEGTVVELLSHVALEVYVVAGNGLAQGRRECHGSVP